MPGMGGAWRFEGLGETVASLSRCFGSGLLHNHMGCSHGLPAPRPAIVLLSPGLCQSLSGCVIKSARLPGLAGSSGKPSRSRIRCREHQTVPEICWREGAGDPPLIFQDEEAWQLQAGRLKPARGLILPWHKLLAETQHRVCLSVFQPPALNHPALAGCSSTSLTSGFHGTCFPTCLGWDCRAHLSSPGCVFVYISVRRV